MKTTTETAQEHCATTPAHTAIHWQFTPGNAHPELPRWLATFDVREATATEARAFSK